MSFETSKEFKEARDNYWASFEELQSAQRTRRLAETEDNLELDLMIAELEASLALTKIPFLNRLYEEWFPLETPPAAKMASKSQSKKSKSKVG
jgi:hypothetical protein